MFSRIVIIAIIVAALLALLFLYGRRANLKTPLMKDSCHGSCADCTLNCKDRK